MIYYVIVSLVIGFIGILINSIWHFARNESEKRVYYIVVSIISCAWPIFLSMAKFLLIVLIFNAILLLIDGYFNLTIKEWFCKKYDDEDDYRDRDDDDDDCLNYVEKEEK